MYLSSIDWLLMMMMMMTTMMMMNTMIGLNDDDAYHLSLSYLCILQMTSLNGWFPMLFSMMLATQVSSTV
jgi:hypothetical protein